MVHSFSGSTSEILEMHMISIVYTAKIEYQRKQWAYIEHSQPHGNRLSDLQQANIPSETSSAARTECEKIVVHLLDTVRVSLNPPLRPEIGCILAEDLAPLMNHPSITADYRAARIPLSHDLCATGWGDAFEDTAYGRIQTHGFFDHRVKVREGLALLPRNEHGGVRRQAAVRGSIIEFRKEFT